MVQPLSQTPGFTEVSPSIIQQDQPVDVDTVKTGSTPIETSPDAPLKQSGQPPATPGGAQEIDPVEKDRVKVNEADPVHAETQVLSPDSSPLNIEIPDMSSVLSSLVDDNWGEEVQEVEAPVTNPAENNIRQVPELEGYDSVLARLTNPAGPKSGTHKEKKRGLGMAALISPGERTPEQIAEFSEIKFDELDPIDPTEIVDQTPSTASNWNFGNMKADSLVIHHTAGRGEVGGVIETFKDRGFPAHFVIDRKGEIHQILGIDQKGQHVRPSEINDVTNSNSWGVEIIAKDDDDVTPTQAKASLRLAKFLNQKHGMPLDRVFGHGEINSHKQKTEGGTVLSLLGK